MKDPGWMAVYGREATIAGDCQHRILVEIVQGEPARAEVVEVRESQTRPPARYNEAHAARHHGGGRQVDRRRGTARRAERRRALGTPATRASIIEGLILDAYIARQGRELHATAKGISL